MPEGGLVLSSFRRACGAAALAFVAVVPAAPAGASAEQLDREFTGTSVETVRCTQGPYQGQPWSTGPATALVLGRSGGLARVRTQLLVQAPSGAVDPAATATLRVREDAGGGPGHDVLASRTLTAADVLAAPAGISGSHWGTAYVVDLAPPAPLGVAAGRTLWVTLERGSTTQTTDFCFAVTASPLAQDVNTVWFHNGTYAGYGTPTRDAGRVVVLSDYLTRVGTTLTATPYLQVDTSDPIRGFEALLTTSGPRRTSVPGQVVEFRTGSTVICTATTGYDGYALCPDTAGVPVRGYTVTFAGDDLLGPSTASASLYG